MSRLSTRAELLKLARVLGVEAAQLACLDNIPAEELRRFRAAVDELLFSQEQVLIRRAARIARWLPVWIQVVLARWLLGPMLTARLAGELPARRSVQVVMRLPPEFIADAIVHLDPRRVRDLIQMLPVQFIIAVAREVVQRHDFITIGHLVEYLPDEAVRAVEPLISDPGDLLQVAFFLESRNRVDHLVHLLPAERIRAGILLVQDASRRELWPMILALLANVSYALKRELGEMAAQQGEAVLNALVNAIQEEDLWEDVLPVVTSLAPDTRRRMANLPILNDPGVLDTIVRDASRADLWGAALPLVGLMDEPLRARVASIADQLPRDASERAVYAALLGEHWEVLLDLVGRMSPAKQREFAEIVQAYAVTDPELGERIARGAESRGFGTVFTAPIPS